MNHFVGYHNLERMEKEAAQDVDETDEDDDSEEESSVEQESHQFGFVIRKKPERFVGNVIWAIQGQGKPRDYYLYNWSIVDGFEKLEGDRFAYRVYGSRGESFPEGILLNDLDWFPEFRKVNANFSLGLQRIAPNFVKQICLLAKNEGFSLPPGCDEILDTEPSPSEVDPLPENPSLPKTPEGRLTPERQVLITERIIRDTANTTEIKRLHDYRCQICGIRLETPAGAYAEAAHVKPLGSPHNGPDVLANILCLCPNHHVLFDYGALSILDDLRLIGMEGHLQAAPGHNLLPEYLRYHNEQIYRQPGPITL